MVAGWPCLGVGPFGFECADEAFDFAVPAWCVGGCEDVAGVVVGEDVGEGS